MTKTISEIAGLPSAKIGPKPRKFEQRHRLPMKGKMTEAALSDRGDGVFWAMRRAADARRSLDVFERLAARDRDAGRPMSIIMGDRIRTARAALAEAEAALAAMQSTMRTKRHAEVIDDEEKVS